MEALDLVALVALTAAILAFVAELRRTQHSQLTDRGIIGSATVAWLAVAVLLL